jgi:2',3'-cyclic-nucleotide 2'-phosphodiesterase (5'-nucleotidase family)
MLGLATLVSISSSALGQGADGFKVQILHSSDNESSFQDPNTLEPKLLNYGAVVEGLQLLAEREGLASLYLTAGDHTLPGPFYQASAEVESLGARGLADIAFFNAMGLTANGIGNHEFDGGIDDFAAG